MARGPSRGEAVMQNYGVETLNRDRQPSALGSGFRPVTGPPFPKFLDPPLLNDFKTGS